MADTGANVMRGPTVSAAVVGPDDGSRSWRLQPAIDTPRRCCTVQPEAGQRFVQSWRLVGGVGYSAVLNGQRRLTEEVDDNIGATLQQRIDVDPPIGVDALQPGSSTTGGRSDGPSICVPAPHRTTLARQPIL